MPTTNQLEALDDQVVPTTDQLEELVKTTKAVALVKTTWAGAPSATKQAKNPTVNQPLEATITALHAILSNLARASPTMGAAPPGENNTESL
jgi:uncharacterized protein YukE